MGSSPLSRGIPGSGRSRSVTVRIIPALAGNTGQRSHFGVHGPDHPRSRGEYSLMITSIVGTLGSSPLSRGILLFRRGDSPRGRIIPALAGNTTAGEDGHKQAADHPRSRGEYARELRNGPPGAGSSPLSRGIPSMISPISKSLGIIPALAGNTLPRL